jgi:DNA mismatch repair ATPase MutS
MLVLTGANMSGKSTLLQQAMLLVILAQVGSMVPAAFASVPVFRHVMLWLVPPLPPEQSRMRPSGG